MDEDVYRELYCLVENDPNDFEHMVSSRDYLVCRAIKKIREEQAVSKMLFEENINLKRELENQHLENNAIEYVKDMSIQAVDVQGEKIGRLEMEIDKAMIMIKAAKEVIEKIRDQKTGCCRETCDEIYNEWFHIGALGVARIEGD